MSEGASCRSVVIIGLGFWLALVTPCIAQWVKVGQLGEEKIDELAAKGGLLYATTSEGQIFLSLDRGASWRSAIGGFPPGAFCSCLAFAGPHLLVNTGKHGIFVSTNDGGWRISGNAGLPNDASIDCIQARGEKLFAGTDKGLFLSTDAGASWAEITSGLPKRKKMISCIARGEGQLMGVLCEGSVYVSTNDGASWASAAAGRPRGVLYYCLATQEGNLLAGTELHSVQIFSQAKRRWVKVEEFPPCEILCFEASGSTLFAGTGGGLDLLIAKDDIARLRHGAGVLMSTDAGISWRPINTGLRPYKYLKTRIGFWVTSLALSGTDLYAGNELGEVWRLSLPDLNQKPPR